MSEAMSEALSNLRDHAPSLPSAKDAKDAVLSHAPSMPSAKDTKDAVLSHLPSLSDVDTAAIRDKLPQSTGSKKSILAVVLGLIALGGAAFAVLRRANANAPVSPSIYTPPLPKP
jgi:LPXTG-motif cell wall-anchored protein